MKNTIVGFVKAHKGSFKKVLIIGGAIVGLAVAATLVKPKNDAEIEIPAEDVSEEPEQIVENNESSDSVEE
jgi:Trk K+ transport system NAD-binding subunit